MQFWETDPELKSVRVRIECTQRKNVAGHGLIEPFQVCIMGRAYKLCKFADLVP
jgi:hypothetical protein